VSPPPQGEARCRPRHGDRSTPIYSMAPARSMRRCRSLGRAASKTIPDRRQSRPNGQILAVRNAEQSLGMAERRARQEAARDSNRAGRAVVGGCGPLCARRAVGRRPGRPVTSPRALFKELLMEPGTRRDV